MLATKRYEYLPIEKIDIHPLVGNHRKLSEAKVAHYEVDILKNGLLEPLVVWEKNQGEYYLVGGFHRLAALKGIRNKNPGYFDHVDVRVVAGDPDEMRALNLKLNADRLDTRITDYFDTVMHLNNVNWSKERIAEFLDKSISWVEDLLRYVPIMEPAVRNMLEDGSISWNRAKEICRAVRDARAGQEKVVLQRELERLSRDRGQNRPKKPITFHAAKKRLSSHLERQPETTYVVRGDDLFCLILVLEGKAHHDDHVNRVREIFPGLLD